MPLINHVILKITFKLSIFTLLLSLVSNNLAQAEESPSWQKAIEKVTQSVVSIRINAVRTFDTEGNKVTQATGFVVDAKRGIILTNRHVVNPGPITAEAIFSNSEEVDLIPIYRDPIHDFGFFKYDPKQLKFIQPQSLKLVDNKAKVGDEIRVIGNDSGEHMSILSATLARLDRSAPQYRRGGYNDFNTFYFQSAADTSGGSSGAPVINIDAEVIALNAGGNNQSASSFFLPLFKVTRALKALQNQSDVKRGTLQTTLKYQTYDQVRRLGLSKSYEAKFRKTNQGDGLLTVDKTVLGGPADKKLRPGDIVLNLRSDKQKLDLVNRYEVFEIFLDQHVGQNITLDILRQGQLHKVELQVADLHAITPSEYIEIAGGVLNPFSYQLARQTHLATDGVYVSLPGFMFSNAAIPRGAVIKSIDEKAIHDLDDLQNALSEFKQGQYFTVKYVNIANPNRQQIANVKFQTNWHLSQRCKRNDITGLWPCEKIQWQSEKQALTATEVKLRQSSDKKINNIAPSLVMVNTHLAYQIDGFSYPSYSGTGLIIDADEGLVITDRNTVPVKMSDVTLTIGGVTEVPAEVLFVHPLHSFSLLKYDPALLKDSELESAPLSDKLLSAGDQVWLVGYQTSNRLISEKLNVSSFDPLILPNPATPKFREANINSIIINNPPAVASGVLLDKKGRVRSWWTNFDYGRGGNQTIDRGLPIRHIIELKEQWLTQGKINLYSLEAELTPLSIASARNYALSETWMQALQKDQHNSQVLQIAKLVAGSDSKHKLQEGDLLLQINGELIQSFEQYDRAIQSAELNVSVWRDGKLHTVKVKTKQLSDDDTKEVYLWAGALVQKTHRAVASQYGIEAKGVYVAWFWYGSPANRYGLKPLHRISEFEGEAVESLEQFIKLSQKHKNKTYVSIRLLDLIGRESIITLKQDNHYWPTQKISWQQNLGWHTSLVSE
jgi:pro-apoptotic serine protease NMA111